MCQRINLEKTKKIHEQKHSSGESDMNKIISKENIFLRKQLESYFGESSADEFQEEPFMEDCLYNPDFLIPKHKLVIEVHGKNKFYPYSRTFNNFASSKNRTYRARGYTVMNINTSTLEGMMRNDPSN